MNREQSYVDVLRGWAEQASEKVALTYLENGELPGRDLTYAVLDRRAREVAVGIRKVVACGDRVLLLHPPGLEFVVAFVGCMYAGVVPVPAYPPRNPRHYSRIEAILDDASATCVLTVSEAQEKLADWLRERGRNLPVVGSDRLCDDAADWHPTDTQPDTVAFLQYTSGSTGEPKGVMISHGNLMANQRMIQEAMGHCEGLIEVSWLPIYHDMGLIGNLMQPLFLGGRCIFMSPVAFLQKPSRWLAAISHYRAQGTGGPNFAYRLCARQITPAQKAGLDLSSVKVFYSGSEPINAADLEEFGAAFRDQGLRREALYSCYGMAETTLVATGSTPGAGPSYDAVDSDALTRDAAIPAKPNGPGTRTLVGCGRSVAGQQLAIVDGNRRRVDDGRVGEIWVQGAHVAKGYWGKPRLTQETFRAELPGEGFFLRTGDLGYLRDGELFVTGRIKDLLIIRGRNYYPQDLEATVQKSHPALALNGAAAFSVQGQDKDGAGQESLIVAAEVQRSYVRNKKFDEIFEAVRREISAEHELTVNAIALLRPGTLPRTSSGKIQRQLCRSRYSAGGLDELARWQSLHHCTFEESAPLRLDQTMSLARALSSQAGPGEVSGWISQWIARRVRCSPFAVDPDRAFADFGLDSVSGVALTSELSEWLKRDVPPTLVWDFPTIRLASEHLAQLKNAAVPRTNPAQGSPVRHQWSQEDLGIDQSAELLARELASLSEERFV